MEDIETGGRLHVNHLCPYYERKNQILLYKAALSNDWEKAEHVYKRTGMEYGVRITSRGETALHVAALAGHAEFVQSLVREMNVEEIRTETEPSESGKGNTAFHCAVISGNVKIAKAILKCEDLHDLATAKGAGNSLPINMAAEKGNEEMVRFLYDFSCKNHSTALKSRDEDNQTLFLNLIKSNIFDIALQLAKALLPQKEAPLPHQREAPYEVPEEALEELALKPLNPPVSNSKVVAMHENAVELVELLWDSFILDEKRVTAFINSPDPNPLIEAAKSGNFWFLSIIISAYPDALFTCDHNKHTIIHHAILNRHVDIFKFIHIGSAKTIATMYRDHEGNNMLHLAAKLAPPNRLSIVPGAALQLQRELLWFEEVKKVMEPHEVHRKKYDLSDFSFDTMFLLVEKMKWELDRVEYNEGLFKELKKVFKDQSSKSKDYHPSSHSQLGIKTSVNHGDVVLLFKKLKKVMEQGYSELRDFSFSMDNARNKLLQESDTVILLEELKSLMNYYRKLEERVPYMTRRLELWELFEVLDSMMSRYELRREGGEDIIEHVKRYRQWRMWPTRAQYERLKTVFEEMEEVMQQHELNKNDKVIEEYTPHDVFVKEHENLMEKGEKWMRDTANSCMIVAVLITTIAFAAAITVPGGINEAGLPHYSHLIFFKTFLIADSISMVSSAISLLNFLSILTARYTVDDFRWSLPNKLFVGLLTIFISIVAMMVAFVLSIFIIFSRDAPAFSFLTVTASSVPIALFLWQHSSLFVDVFRSTYASYFLFKPRNDPSSVFKLISSPDDELKKTK